MTLTAHVSKGTYIRSLARDIARALGTVGHVIGRALRPRTRRCAESGRGCGVRTGMIGVAVSGMEGF